MVLIRFKKIEEGMFITQSNLLRILERIIKISSIRVNSTISASMSMTDPTRMGIESLCEYLLLDTDMEEDDVVSYLSPNLPSWLIIVSAFKVEEKINLSAFCCAGQYKVTFDGFEDYKQDVEKYLQKDHINLDISLHGEVKKIDVKDRIISYSFGENCLFILANIGENSARVDELIKQMLIDLNIAKNWYSIVKEELYYKNHDGDYISFEDYLSEIKVR